MAETFRFLNWLKNECSTPIPKNCFAIIKECLLNPSQSDARISFFLQKFIKNREIDSHKLLEQVYNALENQGKIFITGLYDNCTLKHGKEISKLEVASKGYSGKSLTYGEIDESSFIRILLEMPNWCNKNGRFYDLGSGTGNILLSDQHFSQY